MKEEFLLPIPFVGDISYNWEFFAMTHPALLIQVAQEKGIISRFDCWEWLERVLIVHWVIKLRFNSKYKLPMSREESAYIKPIASLYADIFKACERLHSFTNSEYRNAAHWFGLILKEKRIEGLNKGTKKETWDGIKRENGKLSRYENPFCPVGSPHTYRLFELLLPLSEQNNILRKEVLEPIKKSRKAWSTAYHRDRESQIGISREGKEYRQMAGRGSGLQELSPLGSWETLRFLLGLGPSLK